MCLRGVGGKKNDSRSRDLFRLSCLGGSAAGCTGEAWIRQLNSGMQPTERAMQLYRRACRAGAARACLNLGLAWRWTYPATMAEARANFQRARTLYRRSCELGLGQGCEHWAEVWMQGIGGPASGRRARAIMKRACQQLKYRPACAW
jgi:TPR repeat protein